MMNKVLLTPEKESAEPTERKALFKTMCKVKGKCCKMVIDGGSTDNLVSIEMVEKLNLKKIKHPIPYKVYWLHKGRQILVSEQCEVDLQVGTYKDNIICYNIPMDVCHVLLGRPWQYEKKVVHEGRRNYYSFEKDGIKHVLLPLQEGSTVEQQETKVVMLTGKKYLQQLQEEELSYAVMCKPKVVITKTIFSNLPEEIQETLAKFGDIVVDDLPNEFPPKRYFSHQIDFIPGDSLPNKESYRLTPQENEEVKKKVQELMHKRLIKKSLIPCAVVAVLSPKKDGEWRMCIDSRAINKITIKYRFTLPRMDDITDCLSGQHTFLR